MPIQPVFFGTAGRQLAGLYHPAANGQQADQALLICPSFGVEDINPYRTLRVLAQATAQAGIPTLRFDYAGCGNSEGDADTPDLFQAWLDSIVQAAALLRQRSGASRITLFGLRLGALLAALAAPRCDGAQDLIALAPVISGRAYLREMKALHMAGLAGHEAHPDTNPALFESGGFVMAQATHEALSAIDLLKLDKAPAPQLLLINRDDLPGADKWANRLTEQGCAVAQEPLAGYAEMMADPHHSKPPAALVPIVLARLQSTAASPSSRPSSEPSKGHTSKADSHAAPATAPASAHSAMTLKAEPGLGAVTDTAVFIGQAPALFGMLSRLGNGSNTSHSHNAPSPTQGLGIVMLNAGSTRLIGPNRMYVPLARQWAAQGHTVLRLDIAGIGDSPAHAGKAENTVYSDTALQDVAAAVAFMHQQAGVERIVLMGLCSGAYHAFKAAVAKQPVQDIVMINPLTFFWKEGMSLDPGAVTDAKVAQDLMRHRRSVFSMASWLKLVRGGISPKRITQIAKQSIAWVGSKVYRKLARPLGLPLADDLAGELQQIARQGIKQHYVFADDDPGLELLTSFGGAMMGRLKQSQMLEITLLAHADHTFTHAAPRAALTAHLHQIVAGIAARP